MINRRKVSYGGGYLYSQPETILDQYDFTVNGITKGRGIHICDTSQGMKILTPFRGSRERALLLDEILKYLKAQGLAVEQICRTRENEVLAKDEAGSSYLLKDMFDGSECSARNTQDMIGAVEALAHLHLCLEKCPIEIPEFMNNEKNSLSFLYEKHYHELIKGKNYVKSRKRKNEFEMKFQKEYPHFMEQAKQSVEMLLLCEKELKGRHLCHGDFNHHNVLQTKNGWQIINFENMSINLPMSDLANFLRKMMEKNDWDCELGTELIRAYDNVRRVSEEEYRQLYMLLLFPEKFWKIANHYFNSHKAWLCERDIEKLDRMMEQESARTLFLENLFSIIA